MIDVVDFRRAWTQIVATLTRILGPRHLAIAEEAAQDALLKATERWPHEGAPANPTAWLIQVAKHQALDVLRRERWLAEHATLLAAADRHGPAVDPRLSGESDAIDDDQLAMMFLACHPRLSRDARVALTLKSVCGFGVAEIARALVSTDDAVAQRLVRAKRQLRDDDLRFAVEPADYAERLESVLDVLYLLFNEGYAAHAGADLVRTELCADAIRLAELLARHDALATPAVHAMLALMLLQAARFPARVGEATDLQRLADQDRSLWDRALISGGLRHLDQAARGDEMTTYHLEAGIAACHAIAPRFEDTDWPRILDLYDDLLQLKPTPVVALNRAIALSRVRGAQAGLDALAPLADDPAMRRYYLLPATRGQLALESGDCEAAVEHFTAALACECSEVEKRFLQRQLSAVSHRRSA